MSFKFLSKFNLGMLSTSVKRRIMEWPDPKLFTPIFLIDGNRKPIILDDTHKGDRWSTVSNLASQAKYNGVNHSNESIRKMFYEEVEPIAKIRARTGKEYDELLSIFGLSNFEVYNKTKQKLRTKQRGMIKKLKEQTLKRDEGKCIICGSPEDLDMHHVDGIRSHNDGSNLVILCRMHHDMITHGISYYFPVPDKDFAEKLKQSVRVVLTLRHRGYENAYVRWIHYFTNSTDKIVIEHNFESKLTYAMIGNGKEGVVMLTTSVIEARLKENSVELPFRGQTLHMRKDHLMRELQLNIRNEWI